jgi:hypothetical protein
MDDPMDNMTMMRDAGLSWRYYADATDITDRHPDEIIYSASNAELRTENGDVLVGFSRLHHQAPWVADCSDVLSARGLDRVPSVTSPDQLDIAHVLDIELDDAGPAYQGWV